MKKLILIIYLLLLAAVAFAEIDLEIMADAIYRAEGGSNTSYPYGIKSVKCTGEVECRQICINTIRNNIKRYNDYGKDSFDNYIDFLGSRYCPNTPQHPNQNKTWTNNVKAIYKQLGGEL